MLGGNILKQYTVLNANGGVTDTFTAPIFQPAISFSMDQALGDSSAGSAKSCDRLIRSRCAV